MRQQVDASIFYPHQLELMLVLLAKGFPQLPLYPVKAKRLHQHLVARISAWRPQQDLRCALDGHCGQRKGMCRAKGMRQMVLVIPRNQVWAMTPT